MINIKYQINRYITIAYDTIESHSGKKHGMDMDAIQYLAGHVKGSYITSDVYINISEQYAFKELKKIMQ